MHGRNNFLPKVKTTSNKYEHYWSNNSQNNVGFWLGYTSVANEGKSEQNIIIHQNFLKKNQLSDYQPLIHLQSKFDIARGPFSDIAADNSLKGFTWSFEHEDAVFCLSKSLAFCPSTSIASIFYE